MKTWKVKLITLTMAGAAVMVAFTMSSHAPKTKNVRPFVPPKGCVFRTVMGEESSQLHAIYKTTEKLNSAVSQGLSFIASAQSKNGGWGAGSHARQDIMDAHAVETDPATTAMVSMALLRSGNTLTKGEYSVQLSKALQYLLQAVETSVNNGNITTQTGTQIQAKLGGNIDVILTSQFLSNVLEFTEHDPALKARVKRSQDLCVKKIQQAQDASGGIAGSGWAGVLQSSFATNALEAAQAQGASVDNKALERAREYQKKNYNTETGDVNTSTGAGIVLYSVTGSVRASAKEARKAEEAVNRAKQEGKLAKDAPPSQQNLEAIGYTSAEAAKYSTAYKVYESAKMQAQRDDVMDGFGNNGGEEFLSYLQTGESLIINKDDTWKNWYDNMSGRLLKIQNENGSWNGHHCITSPVFCTATCLLILSVNNDIERLVKQGAEK